MSSSSASTEDDDDVFDADIPKGAKNYITPAGLNALHRELQFLLRTERPRVVEVVSWAAGNGDRSENGDYLYGKKRLREIDRRIRFLIKRIEIAEPVDPSLQPNRNQVFFGATVTYVNGRDEEITVTIVGIDETDLDQGMISWVSPVARALLRAKSGDAVEFRTPSGVDTLEVLDIRYPDGRYPDGVDTP